MILTVEMIRHVLSTNVLIHVISLSPVEKMQNVKPHRTGRCVGAPMDGEEILTQNVSNVGLV